MQDAVIRARKLSIFFAIISGLCAICMLLFFAIFINLLAQFYFVLFFSIFGGITGVFLLVAIIYWCIYAKLKKEQA